MKQKIHIFGASGSGTSTIAKAVCERLNYKHFDTDNYFWYKTEVPFTEIRPLEDRLSWMTQDLSGNDKWILSGSLAGWGDPLLPLFELVVFVYVPPNERIERLKAREFERYGNEILPGGIRHESSKEFVEWAAGYDSGTLVGRNLQKHEEWMSRLDCPLIRVTNINLDESVSSVIDAIQAQ